MLKFTVYGQNIACDYDLAASDSVDYLEAVFIFSRDWDGLYKVAQFTDDNATYNAALVGDRCVVPSELSCGAVMVSVFGQEQGGTKRITTISCPVNIRQSGFVSDGTDTIPPTPDLYSQLIAQIDDAVAKIPTALSEFSNDTGFITADEVPKNMSEFTNDVGYIAPDENGAITIENRPAGEYIEMKGEGVNIFGMAGVDVNGLSVYIHGGDTTLSANGGVYLLSNDDYVYLLSELDMTSRRIINVANPAEAGDAANKGYIDQLFETLVGDIDTALDGILAIQSHLLGEG